MTDRDDLPLPDYDHLALGSLTSRIRSLDAAGLQQLVAYEEAHGRRFPVLQVMRARLDQLAAGSEPSGGSPDAPAPEAAPGPAAPRTVDQTTAAPTINPPSHGVPTNPGQPR